MIYLRTEPPTIRFFSHVDKHGPYCKKLRSYCHVWTGARFGDKRNYGAFVAWDGKKWRTYRAHRWVYETFVGKIRKGLTIDHLCGNTLCVNPRHLDQCSRGVNTLRGNGPSALNARKTHCPKGHALVAGNLVKRASKRECRLCDIDRQREYRKRKKAA